MENDHIRFIRCVIKTFTTLSFVTCELYHVCLCLIFLLVIDLFAKSLRKSHCVKSCKTRVIKAIVKLASIFIVWSKGDRAKEIMTRFASISVFPKVIIAIDGTHINVKAPHVNPDSYVNGKKCHNESK